MKCENGYPSTDRKHWEAAEDVVPIFSRLFKNAKVKPRES